MKYKIYFCRSGLFYFAAIPGDILPKEIKDFRTNFCCVICRRGKKTFGDYFACGESAAEISLTGTRQTLAPLSVGKVMHPIDAFASGRRSLVQLAGIGPDLFIQFYTLRPTGLLRLVLDQLQLFRLGRLLFKRLGLFLRILFGFSLIWFHTGYGPFDGQAVRLEN